MQSAHAVMVACATYAAVAAVTTALPAADDNPFDFFFNRCLAPDDSGNIGACVADRLRAALARDRANFGTGVNVAGHVLVLDPLAIPDIKDRVNSRPKWELTSMRLVGLSAMEVDSALLTETMAAAVVSAPTLTARLQLTVRVAFLPLRPRVTVTLHRPRLMVGSDWSSDGGDLLLGNVTSQLWLAGLNVTVDGALGVGRSLQTALNDNSDKFVEFITPSLEAAVSRQVEALTQKQRNDLLAWLEQIVD